MIDPAGPPARGGAGRFLAFLLAVVFLAVLGGALGYLAGFQVNKHRLASARTGTSGETPDTSGDGSPATPVAPAGKPCPDTTQRDARRAGSPGGLSQIRYIETERSEAWICRDSAGRLWYQGHDKTGALDSDQYGILIGTVTDNGDHAWAAAHDDEHGHTVYLVYPDRLVIEQNGTKRPAELAIHSEAG